MNVSAAGKTKVLYEGLCQYWGLFFTGRVDEGGLGACEVEKVIFDITHFKWDERVDPSFTLTSELEHDYIKLILHRKFTIILLGRLLQLQYYLKVASELGCTDSDYFSAKRLWLCYQLEGTLMHHDLGMTLLKLLGNIEGWYTENEFFDDAVRDTLAEVFKLLTPITSEPLFIVFDEANTAIDPIRGSSDALRNPVLKEILRVWHGHTKAFNVSFVVSGTQINREAFADETEWSGYHRTSNTGHFLEDLERYKAYVENLLPAELRNSPSGASLVRRVMRWLPTR